jgi:hypothetical protein
MRLREASVAGSSPTPTAEEATGEVVTVPTHYLPRSEAEAQDPNSNFNILTGGGATKPAQQETYLGQLSRVMRQYAYGVGTYVADKAGGAFGRSRGQ